MGTYGTKNGIVIWRDVLGVARIATLKDGNIQASLIDDGLTWAGGKGKADATGISHTDSANAYWKVLPDSTAFMHVYINEMETERHCALSVTNLTGDGIQATGRSIGIIASAGLSWGDGDGATGDGVSGYTMEWDNTVAARTIYDPSGVIGSSGKLTAVQGRTKSGIGLYGHAYEAGGIAIRAEVVTPATTALQIIGGIVDGGSQRYTALADAAADTDALNRRTADGRYAGMALLTDRNEPTGFVDITKSTISFNVSGPDRTFTIAPTVTTFDVYCNGVKFSKAAVTKQIANTVKLHYIYFDTAGAIQESTTAWDIASGNCPIATVYWNGTSYVLGDERHGIQMDGRTHEYLHETRGAAFAFGGALTAAADGSTFAVEKGEWYDDDIEHEPAQATTASIFYRAAGAWTWTAAGAPYYHRVSSVPQYDNAGAVADVGANKYSMTWVYWTNSPTHPVAFLMGQSEHNTQSLAEAVDPASIVIGDFVSAEWRLLYKIVWQRNGATITYKSTTDYRRQLGTAGSFVATDHGSLSGLADNDHPQYVLDPATSEQGDVLYWSGTAWARLAHGTDGQVLTTKGHGANPQWAGGAEVAYGTNDVDEAAGTTYVGKEMADGTYLIIKIVDTSGDLAMTYGSIINNAAVANYAAAWAARASTLTYGAYKDAV